MAIIKLDAVTDTAYTDSNGATPAAPQTYTFAHTTGNFPNRIMVIGFDCRPFSLLADGIVSGVTYNGKGGTVSLGLINSSNPLSTAPAAVQMFYLVNPDVGTFNVSVTMTGRERFRMGVRTYYNVNQSVPFRAASIGVGSATPASLAPVSQPNDLVVDTLAINSINAITGPAVGQTQRYLSNIDPGAGSGAQKATHAGSDKDGGAGTTSMSWTVTTGKEWAMIAAAMIPATPYYLID